MLRRIERAPPFLLFPKAPGRARALLEYLLAKHLSRVRRQPRALQTGRHNKRNGLRFGRFSKAAKTTPIFSPSGFCAKLRTVRPIPAQKLRCGRPGGIAETAKPPPLPAKNHAGYAGPRGPDTWTNGRIFRAKITSGSGRKPCWLLPSCAYLPSS